MSAERAARPSASPGVAQPPLPGDTSMALELFSIAGSLNSTMDLDHLLEKIGLAAERLLDSERSTIYLVADDKKSLYFRVASGPASAALKSMTVAMGQGIAGWVGQNRKPQVVNEAQSDPRFAGKFDKASGFVTKSLLTVPMLFRGDLVGVAQVLNKRSGPYTDGDIGLLSSLANLASVAVTNARIIQDQKNFFSHVLELLTGVIETAKPGLADHPNLSARLACAIGRAMGLVDYEYRMMYYAGILHDIGYVGFKSPKILAAVGVVTPTEQHHPVFSVKMLEGIKMVEGAIPAIAHHHECWDGTGFPGKLKGEAIPLAARILALVEAVEEIRMMGVQPPDLLARAIQEAKAGRGTRFDPEVVDVFVEMLEAQGGW